MLVNCHQRQVVDPYFHAMNASAWLSAPQGGGDYLVDRGCLQLQTHITGIDAGKFGQTLDKTIEAIRLFIDYLEHFFAGLVVEHWLSLIPLSSVDVVEHRRRGCFDRSKRRAEIVG